MPTRIPLLCALLLLGLHPLDEPEPALRAAADRVSAVWGATSARECRAAIDAAIAPDAEVFLTTKEYGGVLSREALRGMANLLEATPGLERAWETDETSWIVGERLAVRKGRERLLEDGTTRTVMTTHVFARTGDAWTLVHAHHSRYEPPEAPRGDR